MRIKYSDKPGLPDVWFPCVSGTAGARLAGSVLPR